MNAAEVLFIAAIVLNFLMACWNLQTAWEGKKLAQNNVENAQRNIEIIDRIKEYQDKRDANYEKIMGEVKALMDTVRPVDPFKETVASDIRRRTTQAS